MRHHVLVSVYAAVLVVSLSNAAELRSSGGDVLIHASNSAPVGGTLRLLSKAVVWPDDPVATLTPADPAEFETLETPVFVSTTVPADKSRTYLFISGAEFHSWRQIPLEAPYVFGGSFRLYVTSDALPSTCDVPNQITFGVGHDGTVESAASNQEIGRSQDRVYSFLMEQKALGRIIELRCNEPTANAEVLARNLIRASSKWEVSSRIGVSSVDNYTVHNAFLALFGDGKQPKEKDD